MTSSFTLINGQLHQVKRNGVAILSPPSLAFLCMCEVHYIERVHPRSLFKETDLQSFSFQLHKCHFLLLYSLLLVHFSILLFKLFDEIRSENRWTFSAKCTNTVVLIFISFRAPLCMYVPLCTVEYVLTKVSSFI